MSSIKAQELLHINRFDGAVRRNAHFQYRCLVLEHDMAPWRFPHHDPKTKRNGFKRFDPPTARIVAHSFQGLVGLRHGDNDTAYSITPSLVGAHARRTVQHDLRATSSAWGIGSSSSTSPSPDLDRARPLLGILMYFTIRSGCSPRPWDSPLRGLRSVTLPAKRSCAPAERDLPSLATVFFTTSQAAARWARRTPARTARIAAAVVVSSRSSASSSTNSRPVEGRTIVPSL